MIKTMLVLADIDFCIMAGDTSLVLRRAAAFYQVAGVNTVIAIFNKRYLPSSPEQYLADGISFLLFDRNISTAEMADFVQQQQFVAVIFTGLYTFRFAAALARLRAQHPPTPLLLFDAHGALHETLDYGHGSLLRRYINLVRHIQFVKKLTALLDGALIVTEEQELYYRRFISETRRPSFKFLRINCGSVAIPEFDQITSWRQMIRHDHAISSETRVFVFSGIQRPWHCFPQVLEWFAAIDKSADNVFFAFFTDASEALLKKITELFPKKNYLVKLLSPDEIVPHLAACDVGVILRENNWTNYVAFPNKFSEYLNAGLLVALSPSLREPVQQLKRYGFPYISLDIKHPGILPDFTLLDERQRDYSGYYRKCVELCKYELDYHRQVSAAADELGFIKQGRIP